MSHDDRKIRRAARRAQTLAEGGTAAWRPGTKVVPSGKLYRRAQHQPARLIGDAR
jgi:hypothetical protein